MSSAKGAKISKDFVSISQPVLVDATGINKLPASEDVKGPLHVSEGPPSLSRKGSAIGISEVFTQPAKPTKKEFNTPADIKRIVKVQAMVRAWLARRSLKELANFAQIRKQVVSDMLIAETTYQKGLNQVYLVRVADELS